MHDTDWLAQHFEEHRTRLTRGRLPHARLARARPTTRSRRPGSGSAARTRMRSRTSARWLTTVLSRVCLNMLQAAPLAAGGAARPRRARAARRSGADDDPEPERCSPTGSAWCCCRLRGSLDPAERAAFVLHDMFDPAVSMILGPSWAALRRRHVSSRAARGGRVQREDAGAEADRLRQRQAGRRLPRRRPRGRVRPRCSRSSTPTSCSSADETAAAIGRSARSCAARPPSAAFSRLRPRRHAGAAGRRAPRRSGSWTGSRASSTASPPAASGSPRIDLIADPDRLARTRPRHRGRLTRRAAAAAALSRPARRSAAPCPRAPRPARRRSSPASAERARSSTSA